MSEPTNQEVIQALSQSVNFSFGERTNFGALFGGSNGGSSNTSSAKGVGNTSFGSWSLSSLLDTSINNTAFGYRSQLSNQGNRNTSFGFESMLFVSLGDNNSAFGDNTFNSLSLGSSNVAFGSHAGRNLSIGSGNIFIGAMTGVTTGSISDSIVIGKYAEATESNQFVIGSQLAEAGHVIDENITSTKTWSVIINGVERKILLA